jgi:hypothetical protein
MERDNFTYGLSIQNFVQGAGNVGHRFQVKNLNNIYDSLILGSTGNVGIGVTIPGYKLHVNGNCLVQDLSPSITMRTGDQGNGLLIFGNINHAVGRGITAYGISNPNFGGSNDVFLYTTSGHTGIGQAGGNSYIRVEADGTVRSSTNLTVGSDKRIKKDIIDVDYNSILDILRSLRPCKYKYIDSTMGTEPVWGFIAQEVREILPYSTSPTGHVIPSIYEFAEVSDSNVITFTTFNTSNLESNVATIQIMDTGKITRDATVVEVIDEHTIRVAENLDEWTGSVDENGNVITETTTETITREEYEALESKDGYTKADDDTFTKTRTTYPGTKIFVFGQKVNDFLSLNKNAIWTVATAALQEVDRQLQAEKVKVASLETQLASVLARLDALESA